MADAVKLIQAVIVVLVVGSYTVVLMKGLNKQLTKHLFSSVETEMQKNPHMRRDYEDFKEQLRQQAEQRKQVQQLEEQAKKIQEELAKLSKPQVTRAKYVRMEGLVNEVNLYESPDPHNHSWEGPPTHGDL